MGFQLPGTRGVGARQVAGSGLEMAYADRDALTEQKTAAPSLAQY